MLVGVLASSRGLLRPERRPVFLALGLLTVPMLLHPFHLERFWLPAAGPLWVLSAVGWIEVAGSLRRGRAARLPRVLVPVLLYAVAHVAPVGQALWLARVTGLLPQGDAARVAATEAFTSWIGPYPQRVVPTAGLRREEAAAFLDLVAAELGPGERYGWLGLSSELSPGLLALGIHQRGGSAARLLDDRSTSIDVAPTPGAPQPDWDRATFTAWAEGFDVLFFTDPPDVKDRTSRREVKERWHRRLVEELGWSPTRLGVVSVERGAGEASEVGLFACRRP